MAKSSSLFDLSHKICVVTGGGAGIGEAIAWEMARAGAKVVVSDRDAVACARVADELHAEGHAAIAVACDVAQTDALSALVDATLREWEAIDVLVCNAGVAPHFGPIAEATDSHYDVTMTVNLKSILQLTSRVIPGMVARGGGAVIIMSSIAGVRGNRMLGLYGLSKAANAELARNLAVEWGPRNVRVNAISPGVIETVFASPIATDPERAERRKQITPMRRFGVPRDVAGVAVFLASDAAAFVTGQNIIVDGGTTIGDG